MTQYHQRSFDLDDPDPMIVERMQEGDDSGRCNIDLRMSFA